MPQKAPILRSMLLSGAGLAVFAIPALFGGFGTGVLFWQPTAQGLLSTAAMSLILPAITEEFVFRGPLLLLQGRGAVVAAILSTALFVVWHPVGARLTMRDEPEIFLEPGFLAIVAALGTVAAGLTLTTRRLSPGVFVHWVTVVAWKQVFGGPDFAG